MAGHDDKVYEIVGFVAIEISTIGIGHSFKSSECKTQILRKKGRVTVCPYLTEISTTFISMLHLSPLFFYIIAKQI